MAQDAADTGTRADLEFELESSIECLREVGLLLETYKVEHESRFFDKINKLSEHYRRVHNLRNAVQDEVPIALIQDYIDKGLSPDLYTKRRLQDAESLHQQCKGRNDALKLLRDQLQSEMVRRFGEDSVAGAGAALSSNGTTGPQSDGMDVDHGAAQGLDSK